ncbi:MAG: hypothetical protein F7C35_07425, partial [Desulfurococcales archaeon]|nr:hypothetical protein [Desulfurococcales archaeon]
MENFRVDGKQIWSTKERGHPTSLENALQLAFFHGKTWPVNQVELMRIVNGLKRMAEELKRMGWSHTIIYLNPKQGLKIEHSFYN